MKYLSEEWVSAFSTALGADRNLMSACPEIALVIEQAVATDHEVVSYHVVLGRDAVRAVFGPATSPTVRFSQDIAVAVAIARGELSAQAAFMSGLLRIGGDATAILGTEALLGGLNDSLAALREVTDFPNV